MKQALFFEAHWEKQVSPQDRHLIEKVFSEVDYTDLEGVYATYLRHDFNYKDELLYIVLLHNCTNEILQFHNLKVKLIDETDHAVAGTFTIPVDLNPYTSMPWTFIFKSGYEKVNLSQSNIKLEF